MSKFNTHFYPKLWSKCLLTIPHCNRGYKSTSPDQCFNRSLWYFINKFPALIPPFAIVDFIIEQFISMHRFERIHSRVDQWWVCIVVWVWINGGLKLVESTNSCNSCHKCYVVYFVCLTVVLTVRKFSQQWGRTKLIKEPSEWGHSGLFVSC